MCTYQSSRNQNVRLLQKLMCAVVSTLCSIRLVNQTSGSFNVVLSLRYCFTLNMICSPLSPYGLLYAVGEVMSEHKTATQSKYIPMVLPFPKTSEKIVVFDVADITCSVGLVKDVTPKGNGYSTSEWMYVIPPNDCIQQ